MAAMNAYNYGLDALAGWETDTYKLMLVTAGSFDADTGNVGAVISGGATEVTVSGYARLTVTGNDRVVNTTADTIEYHADTPDFGTLAAGETVTALILYRDGGSDAASTPIGWWTFSPGVATDALDPFTISLSGGIVAHIEAA